jgi:hypothetical protein
MDRGFIMSRKHDAGKGDTYRPVDYKKWSANWDKIFSKKRKKHANRNNARSK